jgi:hypothetical protein
LTRIRDKPPEEREKYARAVENVAGTAFIGGYGTVGVINIKRLWKADQGSQTSATLANFVLHMIECPEAQRKAQEELDKVIGRGRLPDFSDRENLPYMNALYKEVLRVHPALPLGVPRGSVADDEYNGMRIPKGAALIPNAWYVFLI